MQKYNQGFGFFGPMEKCEDGKWVETAEAEKALVTAEELVCLYEKYWEAAMRREIKLVRKLLSAMFAATLGWGIVLVSLLKYAFTGAVL